MGGLIFGARGAGRIKSKLRSTCQQLTSFGDACFNLVNARAGDSPSPAHTNWIPRNALFQGTAYLEGA